MRLFGGSAPRRKRRRTRDDINTSTSTSTTLEWEHFDFSASPKWDKRFDEDATGALVANTQQEWQELIESETKQDVKTAQSINRQSSVLTKLSPEWVAAATRILEPYIQPSRRDRIDTVLQQRTQHCRFLFENPVNPSNVWACLRTIDSFGIQHVDVVMESRRYEGKAALAQKRGMRTAMGSAQWLTLRQHLSTAEAIESLKAEGFRILASDLNPNSKDIRDMEWCSSNDNNSEDEDRPVCIVMGNENSGISDTMRAMADETFSLPMVGFAESFNLSVATAITLAHLSASSKENGKGPLRPGDLDPHEFNCLRLKGILNSLSHKKLGKALLRKEGLEIPPEMNLL